MNKELDALLAKQIEVLDALSENEASLTVIAQRIKNVKLDLYEACECTEDYTDDIGEAADLSNAMTDVLDILEDLSEAIEEEEIGEEEAYDMLDEALEILEELAE